MSTPRRTVALYEKILEAVPGGVVYIAHDGAILLANAPAQAFLGLKESGERYVQDFDNKTYNDDGSECHVADYPVSRCLATGEPQPAQVVGVSQPSGEVRWAVFTALPFEPGDGSPPGAVVSFVDITERKRAEEQVTVLQAELAQRERLATVGTLAAAVAHEVNNPLAYIFLGLDSVSEGLARPNPDIEALLDELAEVQDGARRVRDIARDLMTFARIGDRASDRIDVRDSIETAVRMATPELRYMATVDLRLGDDRGRAAVAAGRLSQVVLNLLINAGRSFNESTPDPRITVTSDVGEEFVVIHVADNGQGVDADIAHRIFEPFFTTSDDGTGLGLSISRSLVEQAGGSLEFVPEHSPGACFRITLPRHSSTVTESEPSFSESPIRQRILLVDDEPAIRRLTKATLSLHHDVTVVDSVKAAIAVLQEADFDAVICDTMLEDGTGIDIHNWVTENRASLAPRFLFITGGAFTPGVQSFFVLSDCPVLHKPFSRDQLRAALDAVLRVENPS